MEHPFRNAMWITPNDRQCQSPILQRHFFVEKKVSSQLVITGLGYFEARINGKNVTADRLVPVASDYERRNNYHTYYYPIYDTFTHRIYYCRYDVSDLIREGENILEIQLANGWYRQTERICEGKIDFGTQLKAIYCLDIDGAEPVVSDGSERWYPSEILENQIFLGEVHDARIRESEPDFYPVIAIAPPESILTEQKAPEKLPPVISALEDSPTATAKPPLPVKLPPLISTKPPELADIASKPE